MRFLLPWIAVPLLATATSVFVNVRLSDVAQPSGRAAFPQDPELPRMLEVIDAERRVDRPGLRLDLEMSDEVLAAFRSLNQHQAEVRISFDGGLPRRALLRVRGASTRRSERKSFLVRLFEAQRFTDFKLRKFFLLNMLHDPNRFEMYTSYRLLGELGLFPGYYQYVTVFANGRPEGLYLLVERPEDAIRRGSPDLVSVMRPSGSRTSRRVGVKYSLPQSDPLRLVNSVRETTARYKGKELEEELRRTMDLEGYFTWLAFNSLVENADSRNEFFLYEERADDALWGRLNLVAWDYDDIQQTPTRPAEILEDPLLYACEMHLDFVIAEDEWLYERYRDVLRHVLREVMTERKLAATLEDVLKTIDRIDSGFPADVQRTARLQRKGAMTAFQERLLTRRQALLQRLD